MELEYYVIKADPERIAEILAVLVDAEEEGVLDFPFSVQHLTKEELPNAL